MKIRNGFVSNSSSSSFVCCVCARSEVVYDGSLGDVGMAQCIHGHTICQEELLKGYDDNKSFYEIDSKYCPVCQFKESSSIDMARYLLKETKIPRDEVFAEVKKVNKRRKKLYDHEYILYACQKANLDGTKLLPTIREKFKTYDDFLTYINNK